MPEETKVIEKTEVEEKKDNRDEVLDRVTEVFIKGLKTGDMKQAISLIIEYLLSAGLQISPEELMEEIKIRLAEKGIELPAEGASATPTAPPVTAPPPTTGGALPPEGV